jgi:hypothetical protein
MGQKKKNNRMAGKIAERDQADLLKKQSAAQEQYDTDIAALRDFEVTDFYDSLSATTIGRDNVEMASQNLKFNRDGVLQEGLGELPDYVKANLANLGPAGTTNVANLARGADTGLTNTMRNLQVSTAGAALQAQEADQSLAATQDLIAQTGSGGGGASALAAAAARSKAGIAADIDMQVKQNEMLRAQGESTLQKDLLGQGNLASQFDLGQQQFNKQQQNQFALTQFGAENQMNMFNTGQQQQQNMALFSAANQMAQFNAGQNMAASNSEFQSMANANLQNATAINNALAQDAQTQTSFDLSRAAGQAQSQSNEYDVNANLLDISTNELSEIDAKTAENQAVIDLGKMSKKSKFFSDRRLKKNIKLIGKSNSGINIYLFEYINKLLGEGVFQGVMSDEIPAHAIVKHHSGYYCVDYSLLDVKFKSLT